MSYVCAAPGSYGDAQQRESYKTRQENQLGKYHENMSGTDFIQHKENEIILIFRIFFYFIKKSLIVINWFYFVKKKKM